MMHLGFIEKIFTAPAVVVHPEDVQERRLPSARWTHDRNEVAFLDIQIDLAQDVANVYSACNAWTGFTRVARLAGSHMATNAARVSTAGATVKAIGSRAPIP